MRDTMFAMFLEFRFSISPPETLVPELNFVLPYPKATMRIAPTGEATTAPDAGFEELSNRGGSDRWHRTGGEDQEGTIQTRQARRTDGEDAGDLASRPCCIIRITLNRN